MYMYMYMYFKREAPACGGTSLLVCTMTPSAQMLEAARRCRAAQGQSVTLVRSRSASGPTTPHALDAALEPPT